jgi:hypothetical protein
MTVGKSSARAAAREHRLALFAHGGIGDGHGFMTSSLLRHAPAERFCFRFSVRRFCCADRFRRSGLLLANV